MTKELEEAIYHDFPILFRFRTRGAQVTPMHHGLCIGDGWEPLLRRMAEKVEPLLRETLEQYGEDKTPGCEQVKEKFAGLRCHMSWGDDLVKDDRINAAIHEAEAESLKTCETCGTSGLPRRGGWLRTLCDEHAKGREPYVSEW